MPYAALACGLLLFLLSIAKAYRVLFALGPAFVWLLLADRSLSSGERAARGVLAFARFSWRFRPIQCLTARKSWSAPFSCCRSRSSR